MTSRRTALTLGAVLAALAAGNVVRSTVLDDTWQLPFNLALAVIVVALAVRLGRVTSEELGARRAHLRQGLRLGLLALAAISLVVTVAALIPATHGFFDDDRAEVGFASYLFDVLVDIPFGTVVLEELAFRGCILALLLRLLSRRLAVLVASLLFGLWHVAPAWTSAADNSTLEEVSKNVSGLLGVIGGTVVVTAIAGAVFCWLRLRSSSLLAPMMAHYAVNAAALTASWLIVH